MCHSKWALVTHGLTINEALEIWTLSFGMVYITSTASPIERRWSFRLKWDWIMGQDRSGLMATLKLMGQRPTTHYILAKLRDLAVVMIAWLFTMECNFQPMTGTMTSWTDNVQAFMEVMDGGIATVIMRFWLVTMVIHGYTGETIKELFYIILLLRWNSVQRTAK